MSIEKERETQLYKAKLADEAERYDEMVEHMKKIAELGVELTLEERNMLSVAYKNSIGARRASWRTIYATELDLSKTRGKNQHLKLIRGYRLKVEDELSEIGNAMIGTIDQHLLPNSASSEATVFYHKLKGDYLRYLAEFESGEEMKELAEQSLKEYEAATAIANTDLTPTHKVRLGLGLNYSVLYYDIMKSPKRALHMVEKAYEEAIPELDKLDKESQSYKDSIEIIQLLKENIRLWGSELKDERSQDRGHESKADEPEEDRGQESKPAEPAEDDRGKEPKPVEEDKGQESKAAEPPVEDDRGQEPKPSEEDRGHESKPAEDDRGQEPKPSEPED